MKALTDWWTKRQEDNSQAMWESWKAPHRRMALVALQILGPGVRSVYEIGCGSGPNLRLLKEAAPDLTLGGSDPSPGYAAWASEHLGIHVDTLTLPEVPTERWDCFLSCYVLAYVAPEDAVKALKDLDGRFLILMEPNGGVFGSGVGLCQLTDGVRVYGVPEYHHDYPALLAESGWRMTWRWPIMPSVQGLNALLIAERS